MPLHIGKIIQQRVKAKRVPVNLLTSKLNTSRGNIYDIYKRETIDTGILIKLCQVLEYDFFEHYYQEEPMKTMRYKELQKLQKELVAAHQRIKQLDELNTSQKKIISLMEKTASKRNSSK